MYSNYDYYDDFGAVMGFFISIIIFAFLFSLAIGIFKIICNWKIFKKAGKNGWEAIIPYYNLWIFFEISGYPGWFGLISLAAFIPYIGLLIPIVMFVLNILASLSLSKKFHKTDGFGVLLALLPIVGLPILAFGNSTYDPTLGEQNNLQPNEAPDTSSSSTTTKSTTKTEEKKFCGNCGTKISASANVCPNCGSKVRK